jgi:3-oxo-5alpha-steroid 4-dehydrogenase
MVERHCPEALRANVPIGTPHDDGRGIRMGQGAGGAVVGMEHIEVGIPLAPPRSLVRGVLVNGAGERFMNEDTYAGRLGKEFLLRQDGEVYFVHDDETFAVNVVGYTPTWVAASAGELGAEIGLPPGALEATLDRYNEHAAQGEDPDFHKAPEWVRPLVAPYGAVDLRVTKSWYATFTLGGLATTPDGEVTGPTGAIVPGLFAAGRTTAGIAGAGYVSGISLGDGTFFGRRAGRSAASGGHRTPTGG